MGGEHTLKSSFSLFWWAALALVGMGCATSTGGGTGEAGKDLRGTIGARDPEPHLLVTGPAVILHLDTERRSGVTLFRVARREGTAADCVAGPQRNGDVIEMAHGSLQVSESESVCAMVTHGTSLTGHAREGTRPSRPLLVEHQASLH